MKFPLRSFCILWFCGIWTGSWGQTKPELTLAQELQRIERAFQVTFTYNHSLLGGLPLKRALQCDSIQACMAQIKKQIPVAIEDGGAGSFMILPVRKDISFTIVDAETKNPITLIRAKINQGEEYYVLPHKKRFTLDAVFPLDTVHIQSAFYKGIRLKAQELLGKREPIQMRPENVVLNEVFITDYVTQGIDAKVADHSFKVSMPSLGLLAGETDGDIFNVIKNIPGIHTPSGKPGTLNFRGTTWDQTILQFDDIPIYHNGHFFGSLSPFNPSLVNTIEIQRNTLHAKWGGRVGGLLNMTTGSTIPDSTAYEVLVNTVFGGVNAQIPLIKDKLGLYVAGRSNYPGINSPKLTAFSNLNFQGSRLGSIADEVNSENFEVGFYDINSKLVYHINPEHQLSVNFINIQNRLSARLDDSPDEDQDFRDLDLDNWGASVKWEGKISDKVNLESRFSTSSLELDNTSEGFSGTQRSRLEKYSNTINDTRFISEVTIRAGESTTLETGYSLTGYNLRFDERVDQDNFASGRNQNAILHSTYASSKNNWGDNFTTTIGLHGDYYGPSNTLYIDPRVSLSFRINNALYLKNSLGRSRQFIQKKLRDDFDDFNDQAQFWFLPDKTTAVLKSNQIMLGTLYTKNSWLVDFEMYLRNTDNVTRQAETENLIPVTLKSWGADLFLKKRWNTVEALLSYSLSETVTEAMETSPIYFDQRHILNLTVLLHLKQWEFAANWGYYTGMPVIVPGTLDMGNMDETPDNLQTTLGERFENQHQLDIATTFSFPKTPKDWKGIIGLSFLNVYDRQNTVNLFQNNTMSDTPFRSAIRFSPNLQVRFRF